MASSSLFGLVSMVVPEKDGDAIADWKQVLGLVDE